MNQLGFDTLLQSAETDNRKRYFERETAHLPDTMAEALPYYRVLLRQHHAAMLAADVEETMRLREDAYRLALKLNGGEGGIIANDESPGCVLSRKTEAARNIVPCWGQAGDFIVDCDGMLVRIAMKGIFGIASRYMYWPGFSARAVDCDQPFISQTG